MPVGKECSYFQEASEGRGGRRNSAGLTACLIIADVVGVGVLSMANAVACFGWLLGAVMIAVLFAMNVHIAFLLWHVHRRHPEAKTYMDLASATFADLPHNQQKLLVDATGLIQYSGLFSMLGLSLLCIGKGLGMLFYHVPMCLPLWSFLGCVLVLPFHITGRKLGTWKSLVWVNLVTILGSTAIPLAYMFWHGVEASRIKGSSAHAIEEFTLAGSLTGSSTMLFAFSSQFMLVEIMSEMRNIEEFPSAFSISAPFQFGVFLFTGLGGYYFRGFGIDGLLISNIPFGICFRLASASFVAHMLITYMIKSTVVCAAIQTAVDPTYDKTKTSRVWITWTIIVLITLSSSWFMAQVVPFFVDFVEVIGASLTPIACFLIPIGLYVHSAHRSEGTLSISPLEKAVLALETTLAIVLCFWGTYVAVFHIVEHWHTYGYPFSCHCEEIWNTCECSGSNPGLVKECAVAVLPATMIKPASLVEWGAAHVLVGIAPGLTDEYFFELPMLSIARNATARLLFSPVGL